LFRARYRLPPSLARRVTGRRVAIVDDVISAGSSARATFAALRDANARVVAVGALLLMGDAAPAWFADFASPVVASARTAFEIWPPESCPLCAANIPVENPASDPPA
jgi:orotate phosphoribosyltransferase